jgi:hypothetical protein
MQLKHLMLPVKNKFRTQPSVGELMLKLFLGSTFSNFGSLLEKGHNSKEWPL